MMLIGQVLRLTKWEWFKLRRLRMPWILLAIAVLVSQVGIWVNYLAYHNDAAYELVSGGNSSFGISLDEWEGVRVSVTCVDIARGRAPTGLDQLSEEERRFAQGRMDEWLSDGACDNTVALDELRRGFTLPNSMTTSISDFSSLGPVAIGLLLIMILTASLVGTEYGWGTLRTVLAGGIHRWTFLAAKLLLLLWLCTGALIVIAAASVASSLATAVIPPDEMGGLTDAGRWSDVVIVFFKSVYGFLPFIALSVLATVLTSSRSAGIAISIGYFIIETAVAPLLNLHDTLAKVADYPLIQNFLSWTAVPAMEDSSYALQAFVVILAQTFLLVVVTSWVFRRRDVGGAVGD